MIEVLEITAYIVWEAAFWFLSLFDDAGRAIKWLCAITVLTLVAVMLIAAFT